MDRRACAAHTYTHTRATQYTQTNTMHTDKHTTQCTHTHTHASCAIDISTGLVNMDSMMPVRRPMDGTMPTRTDAHLQPLLGVSPLGPVMLSKKNIAHDQAHMLETVFRHLPQPTDSEKVR